MPNVMDKVAARGVRFDSAYVNSPVCAPSRASFLSGGFHPHNTGVITNASPTGGVALFNDAISIATAFQGAGYATGYVGKYMNEYHQLLEPYIPPGGTRFDHVTTVGSSDALPSQGVDTALLDPIRLYHYREHALNFIEDYARSPFLLVLTTEEPHRGSAAWTAAATGNDSLFTKFLYRERGYGEADLSDKPIVLQNRAAEYPAWWVDSVEEEDEYHRDQLRSLVAVDDVIGALFDRVEALDLLDNTVFVIVSDHGVLWGEHGQFDKGLAYEEAARVPLIIAMPGVTPRTESQLVIGNIDVPATLFDLAGIVAPTEGSSLAPLIADPNTPWRTELPLEFWDNLFQWTALRTRDGAEEW
jgi:arylsulfatase A-like enzyme